MIDGFISVATDEEVALLVGRIHNTDRLPIFVGTLREGEESPPWDAAGLASRLKGEADLYGAPRIRFTKKGTTVKFLAVGHHDDDL